MRQSVGPELNRSVPFVVLINFRFYDCQYRVNRHSGNVPQVRFTLEVARLTSVPIGATASSLGRLHPRGGVIFLKLSEVQAPLFMHKCEGDEY